MLLDKIASLKAAHIGGFFVPEMPDTVWPSQLALALRELGRMSGLEPTVEFIFVRLFMIDLPVFHRVVLCLIILGVAPDLLTQR